MTRITTITRIRFMAGLAPVILLFAAPYIAGGFYVFGGQVDRIEQGELAATRAAHGMETALYKMQWGLTQRDSGEILMDQRRAFMHWFDLARDRAGTDEQRRILASIAEQASPLFDQLRNSSPADESVDHKARDLDARINDLIGADDSVLQDAAAASRAAANRLIVVTLVAALAIPWICFVVLSAMGGRLGAELRAIRRSFESISERPAGVSLAQDKDFKTIDDSLARLGFPKPNPMLSE